MLEYLISHAHVYLTKSAEGHSLSRSLAGRLILSKSGWLILSVPSFLIRGAFDALHEVGLELPEEFGIPIISPEELSKINANKITERGHYFKFNLGPVRSCDSVKNGISKRLYISIYNPELKKLRHSYGLPSYPLDSNCFQLPIAVRKSGVVKENDIIKDSEYFEDLNPFEYDLDSIERILNAGMSNM